MPNKKMYISVLVLAVTLAASSCSSPVEKLNSGDASPTLIEQKENIKNLVKTEDVIISAQEEATGSGSDIFKEITVQTRELSKTFPWINVTNPSYYPIVQLADINDDNNDEIVIILTNGYGTGVYEQEIHILNRDDLSEISIEEPVEAVRKRVTSTIVKENNTVKVLVELDGQKFEKTYKESDAGVWNEEIGFGAIVNYTVSNNKITAAIPGNVSPAEFAVVVEVEYGPDLKISKMSLNSAS
ncbi:hypothetical protein [Paenibacillus fonticola]|uniref:hypothetical protein n=1 Tax=Paenibacillus fonticola TaxID=379896 RepID=UPI0012F7BD42|nr:hypothetical protein [Paenibacillus fonticola]